MWRKFFHAAVWALPMAALLFVASCGESNDDGGDKPLKLSPGTKQEQSVFADDKETPAPIRFTATAPWRATVAEVQTKAEATAVTRAEGGSEVDWLELSAYEGKAGDFSLTMTLKVNATGQARKAEIRIECDGTTLTITVEQKATKENGELPDEAKPEKPSDPDTPQQPNLKGLVSTITEQNSDSDYITISRFIYDETTGRLAKMTIQEYRNGMEEETRTLIFTYGEGTISYEYKYYSNTNNELWSQWTNSIVLDKKGRAVSGKHTGLDWSHPFLDKYEFTYDAEGYLIQTKEQDSKLDESGNVIAEYGFQSYCTTWTDGNPTQVEYSWKEGSEDFKNLGCATYGTIPNTTNLDLNWLCILDCSEEFAFSVGNSAKGFAAMGYMGKRSKNMVETLSTDGEQIHHQYAYELDKERRIHKITETDYNTGETYTIYTITYTE